MIHALKSFFDKKIFPAGEQNRTDGEHALHLATVALLLEVSRADLHIAEEERATVVAGLRTKFGLSEKETREIVELAEREGRTSTSYYGFTELINERFPLARKIRIVEQMWQIAIADAVLEKHEEHLIRRLSGLLHVPHREFIDAKLRVRGGASARSGKHSGPR